MNNLLLQVPQTSQDLAANAKGMSRRAKQIRREIQLVEACRNCLSFPIEQYLFVIEKIRSGMRPSLRYFKCVYLLQFFCKTSLTLCYSNLIAYVHFIYTHFFFLCKNLLKCSKLLQCQFYSLAKNSLFSH